MEVKTFKNFIEETEQEIETLKKLELEKSKKVAEENKVKQINLDNLGIKLRGELEYLQNKFVITNHSILLAENKFPCYTISDTKDYPIITFTIKYHWVSSNVIDVTIPYDSEYGTPYHSKEKLAIEVDLHPYKNFPKEQHIFYTIGDSLIYAAHRLKNIMINDSK